jgi:hypothetical protein
LPLFLPGVHLSPFQNIPFPPLACHTHAHRVRIRVGKVDHRQNLSKMHAKCKACTQKEGPRPRMKMNHSAFAKMPGLANIMQPSGRFSCVPVKITRKPTANIRFQHIIYARTYSFDLVEALLFFWIRLSQRRRWWIRYRTAC